MKRSKAFILVEILTGMLLQAGFIVVLCTSFYLMVQFYTRTQQVLNARQKGEKVIAYVDSRIRNADLGLSKCRSSQEIRDALKEVTSLTKTQITDLSGKKVYLPLPVAVTSGDGPKFETKNTILVSKDNKIRGNTLTLLYTQRPLGLNMTIRTIESTDAIISGCNYPVEFETESDQFGLVTVKYHEKTSEYTFAQSDFLEASTLYAEKMLGSYTALSGTGFPMQLMKADDKGSFSFKNYNTSRNPTVYPGDELLYVKCERFFVKGTNFTYKRLPKDSNSWPKEEYQNELGILEIYFELDMGKRIIDMYVLASGGNNDSRNTTRPSSWPQDFWKSDYKDYIVYVSHASWKLKNLPSNFIWN